MLKTIENVCAWFFVFFGLVVCSVAAGTNDTLSLAAPFTDNMILQREMAVAVWGVDTPGNIVTVTFAGQEKKAKVNDRGEWRVALSALKASAVPRHFTVTNDQGEKIVLENVLVGEVWFSSGQSNMVWPPHRSMVRALASELVKSEVDIPIREISIDTVSAIYPQKHATSDGGWKLAERAGGFSALSLSFAHSLYEELQVPIGILLSAHSNTRIEAFTARAAIEAHPALAGDAALIHLGDPLTAEGKAAFDQYYEEFQAWQEEAGPLAEAGLGYPSRPNLPGIAGMWRGPSQFFSGKIAPVVPYTVRGTIWCQGTSNAKDGEIYAARMEALVNGWRAAWGRPDMPFYFTQMQPYGAPNPDSVGFADIRQAQFKFFLENRDHVGMVVQTDLNSARPGGIHYFNKLHPGMRLARWALAHEYGKNIAYTGPIYKGYTVKGNKAIVSFENDSLCGGLMVGSKGMAKDRRDPGKYVEPARPTPGEPLNHFRLCGEDGKWFAAEAKIVGDTVVVQSKHVAHPVGVQYAYNAVPENSNLYNKAGLPATPFAAMHGKLIFQEDLRAKAEEAPDTDAPPPRRILRLANYLRHGVVLQREKPIPIWGHANAGVEVTVQLGGQIQRATADEHMRWKVVFDPMPATQEPIELVVKAGNGREQTVRDVLIGDVWFLMGSKQLSSNWPYDKRDKDAAIPEPLPLVREFRRKTKASTSTTPRRWSFEIGGGRFRSAWLRAAYDNPNQGVSEFAYHFARTLNRPTVPQGFITMSSGRRGRSPQRATPLSWTSYDGVKNVKHPAFQDRLDELALQYPGSGIAQAAAAKYVAEVKSTVEQIIEAHKAGADLSVAAPQRFPKFPVAGSSGDVASDMIPTYSYNWCVSPFVPMSVAGVIWVPSPYNIGDEPTHYADELEVYAASLSQTYGQEQVPFLYAHPSRELIEDIREPSIPGAERVLFDTWPESLHDLAIQLAETVPYTQTGNGR